jgi:hypothetical protein
MCSKHGNLLQGMNIITRHSDVPEREEKKRKERQKSQRFQFKLPHTPIQTCYQKQLMPDNGFNVTL